MRHTFHLIFVLILAASHCGRLSAQSSLVANGGFECGLCGWSGTYGVMPAGGFALEGTEVGIIIDVASSSTRQPLFQYLPTVAGATYTFSFGLLSGYGRVGEFPSLGNAPVMVSWGDEVLGVLSNPSTADWQLHEFQVTAQSDSTAITFRTSSDMHWQLLDDVRVVAVPEPSIAFFLIGNLTGLAVWRLKRRRHPRVPRAGSLGS